jgi:hypothetical protein
VLAVSVVIISGQTPAVAGVIVFDIRFHPAVAVGRGLLLPEGGVGLQEVHQELGALEGGGGGAVRGSSPARWARRRASGHSGGSPPPDEPERHHGLGDRFADLRLGEFGIHFERQRRDRIVRAASGRGR